MTNIKKSFLLLSSFFALALPSFAQTKTESKQKQTQQTQKSNEPVLVLTTVTVSQSTGCWATLFDENNFKGDSLTLMGDNQLPNLRMKDGSSWEGRIDSVAVGPKADLVLYGKENYKDVDSGFGPGTKTADLDHLPIGDSVESLKIACK